MKAIAYFNHTLMALEIMLLDGDYVAQPVGFTMIKREPNMPMEPTLRLSHTIGQDLMQQLWDAGFRPNDGAGSGAEASALKAHIKFAERVAEKLLDTI